MAEVKKSPELIVEERIEEARREGARELNFNRLGLTQLPTSIEHLTQLQKLHIPYHQLTALPESMGQLTQLQVLDVSDNQLMTLPRSLDQLIQLKWIFLHGNPRLKLPPEVLGPTPIKIMSNGSCQFIVNKKPATPASILEYYFCNRTNDSPDEIETTLVERGDVAHASTVRRLMQDPVRVVFSYSRKDEELRDQLETHLKLLQRQGVIGVWHDRKITAGEEWKGVIDDNFKHADIILLLTSPDFLNSDYCYDIEMKASLERHDKGEAKVIPVILRTCQWRDTPFGELQPLPKDGKPVRRWRDRDEAWNDVAEGIKKVAEEMRGKRG